MKEDFIEDVTFELFSVELAVADVAVLSMIQDKLLPDAPKDGKTYGRNTSEWVEVSNGVSSHTDLSDKNAETNFQHVDTTTTKETLVNDDKVAILDSETGKIVLTNKENVGYRITDAISTTSVWSSSKTNEEINKLLPLIYAGL